ncbi:MAG: PIN domain-containing protein [Fimbriimonadaceae bacterium]
MTGVRELPQTVLEAAKANPTANVLSAYSLWEAHLLLEKGRIQAVASAEHTIRNWLSAYPFPVVPVDGEIALLARTLEFQHEDPADRFIAATAYQLGLPMATLDARLGSLPWLKVIPAP